MKHVTIKEWVKALRSGKYKQATGALYNTESGGFCCLGVLGHLMGGEPGSGNTMLFKEVGLCNSGHLPTNVAKTVGLNPTMQERLSVMNDSGISFNEIADFIEGKIK